MDKVNRQVYLNGTKITEAKFPSATAKTAEWEAALQKQLRGRSKALSLDRIEAQLAIQEQRAKSGELPIKNDPPKILVSTVPAMMVLIDGDPVLRKTDGDVERVINTRPLLLKAGSAYYLHVFDGWMEAESLTGTWIVAKSPPTSLNTAMNAAVKKGQADLLTGESGDTTQPKPSLGCRAGLGHVSSRVPPNHPTPA